MLKTLKHNIKFFKKLSWFDRIRYASMTLAIPSFIYLIILVFVDG